MIYDPVNIDSLVYISVFSTDEKEKRSSRDKIWELAKKNGAYSSSIHNLYMAFGKKEVSGFTVPAINIRTLTYDTSRIIFQLALEKKAGAMIFEIARSEIGYTKQRPDEYATVVTAAAVREGYRGPIFIQGDHYQFKASLYKIDPPTEIKNIKDLVKESIDGRFYNIDIDASTLVDLNKPTLADQQKDNYEMTAAITKYIRELEPEGVTISVGGEIGHIGGKNSTPEDFVAFMDGYRKNIDNQAGISKVSVQTGTSHGGIPLPDGTIAKIKLDFGVLEKIGQVARDQYQMGGAVQHGASTLPNELFDQFPQAGTLEIHLSTGFQNIVYGNMPENLRKEMYEWINTNCKDEWKDGLSKEQFIYKTRKKALGPFKEKLWKMSDAEKQPIREKLKEQLSFLMDKLKINNTADIVSKYCNR